MDSNPFAALFGSIEQAQVFCDEATKALHQDTSGSDQHEKDAVQKVYEVEDIGKEINMLAESILRVSLNQDPQKRRPNVNYFEDIAEPYQAFQDIPLLDSSNIGSILFEILILDRHEETFQASSNQQMEDDRGPLLSCPHLEDTEVMTYLYCCHRRCRQHQDDYQKTNCEEITTFLSECESVILNNASTCLQQQALFEHQQFVWQFIQLCIQEDLPMQDPQNHPCRFLQKVCEAIDKVDQIALQQAVTPVLQVVKARLMAPDMTIVHKHMTKYLKVLHFFTTTQSLATIFMSQNTPEPPTTQQENISLGHKYQDTALGAAMSLSILPRGDQGPYTFFAAPSGLSQKEIEMVELNVWQATEQLVGGVHKMFVDLMKVHPDMKHYTLRWLGLCIQGNASRAKLWASNLPANLFVGDAFAVNMTHLLLLFCRPFSQPDSPKLLKVQPTYAMATAKGDKEMLRRGVHLLSLHKETCMIPPDDVAEVQEEETFSFITECFFAAHRSIHVFLQPVMGRLVSTVRDLNQIQRMYNDMVAQQNNNTQVFQQVKTRMDKEMCSYLNRKTALTQPQLMSLALDFQISTSSWLCLVATSQLPKVSEVTNSSKFPPVEFPLPESPAPELSVLPEFLMENIINVINHIHRFGDSQVLEAPKQNLQYLLTLVLVYMASPRRLKNPHLRAELAEMLASLMPQEKKEKMMSPQTYRKQLFSSHPHISHLPEALMQVFVSIEMTGEAVAFEQKFQYRRPMYAILKHIWGVPTHRAKVCALAQQAEANMMSSDPPMFLKFINLLVNDATFLLDEALIHMGQIKEKQQERERGDWARLPEAQRHQEESNLTQLARLAQIYNIMGSSTISTLRMVSEEIQSVFIHPTFVDRMAAMLNYFLCRLVGPKTREISVKDKKAYDFKPQETVSDISAIYLHLRNSDVFLQAVFEDERSYSDELFSQAVQVLERIGESPQSIVDFMHLDERIKKLKTAKVSESAALADAPEEFLDPIMGTLMKDPVMLPGSKNIVDRNVIARHILSDQTDPFNRQPLTLDLVIPQTDLKAKIDAWVADKMSSL